MTDLGYRTTDHAERRMRQRGVPGRAIEAALTYGRQFRRSGAVAYVIGRKEVRQWRSWGVNLSDYVNLQVVCSADGTVITVYRNSNIRSLCCSGHHLEKGIG